jgi:type III pantothenate kinase
MKQRGLAAVFLRDFASSRLRDFASSRFSDLMPGGRSTHKCPQYGYEGFIIRDFVIRNFSRYDCSMDINLLVLNLGNTRLAIGVFAAGKLESVTRIPLDNRADWQEQIKQAWLKIEGTESPAVAGASVNPPLLEAVEHAAELATGTTVQWVGRDLDLPIEVKTESPKETGVDRVLNIAAAYEQMGKACVVADAGSALTVDACDDTGAFLGGAIAPGAGMMLSALHANTAKLPLVKLEAPTAPGIGRNTQQAILQGVYTGLRGMVKELVESYATELGTWPDLITTGGDAEKLFGGWELVHAVAPDLTLYGIALAYTEHHIKHG